MPSPSLNLYRAAGHILSPLAPLLLKRRAARGKEDASRLGERLGHAGLPRPDGRLVWMHGASIGEAVAALPLAAALQERCGVHVLFTTGTVTSARILGQRAPHGVLHQFAPLDLPDAIRRFLDHWRPELAVFVESEIWPGFIAAARERRIKLALVNARISERSARRWQRLSGPMRLLLGSFDVIAAQSARDADRLRYLGARGVVETGNLKFDTPTPPIDAQARQALEQAIDGRPVWAAASTHPGEEDVVLAAHAVLRESRPDLLLILAPRHPERAPAVEERARDGMAVSRRSRDRLPGGRDAVHLFDTVGEMGLLYAVAPQVFMGGSLVPHGGQNPIEPIRLGAAIAHGPHVHNFADIYPPLDAAGAARTVSGAEALKEAMADLLANPQARQESAERGRAVLDGMSGALERTSALLAPLLDQKR